MNPEDFESLEFDLFKPIIDAFVKKYPEVENGPCHIIFGDYNLERHWLEDMRDKIVYDPGYHKQTEELLIHLIDICDLLEIE